MDLFHFVPSRPNVLQEHIWSQVGSWRWLLVAGPPPIQGNCGRRQLVPNGIFTMNRELASQRRALKFMA